MALLRRKSLLRTNLQLWLEDKLLREGLYSTVSSGLPNGYGQDTSVMTPLDDEPGTSLGQVWQSAYKNWVYESGIPPSVSGIAPPIVASGITVDSVFYPDTTVGAFAHYIDYPNGRVVFDTPISTNSVVQGEFSFKEVTVDFADRFDNERMDLLTETTFKDNPQQSDVQNYPLKRNRTLPAIWIEILSRKNDGYELGSKSLVSDFMGMLHIWSRDTYLMDLVEDILADAHRDVLIGINFNTAPFPLLSKGRRNPAWPGYAAQARLWQPWTWQRIYLDNMETEQDKPLFEVERMRVKFMARIYPNF